MSNNVLSIQQDEAGNLWFGTEGGGVSRLDRQTFTTFTTADGLADNWVTSIAQDNAGRLWFGTRDGVSRYDGIIFTTFTTTDGLSHDDVRSILRDKAGHLWFGTDGVVVSRYDGQVFMTLTRQSGLPGNSVRPMLLDHDGSIWIGTLGGGVTRYRQPPLEPPGVSIDAVVTDRRYEGDPGADVLPTLLVSSSVGLVAFEFHGRSFKTRPDGLVYRYRLKGFDEGWKNTNAQRVEYQDLPKTEHSRLAGTIANLWGNDDFDIPNFNFKSFVTGVALHDVGYGYFDSYGIGEMNPATRLAVLRQLVDCRSDDAIAQTVMHFHVLRLLDLDSDEATQPLRVACEKQIESAIEETGISRQDYLWADRITDLCDVISFEFCFDRPSQRGITVYPKQDSRDEVTVNFEIGVQGEIKVSPWPFRVDSYEGFILAYEADGYPELLNTTVVGYKLSEY